MTKHKRFLLGLLGVAAVVSYLVWTGISQTVMYFLTPTELMAKVADDPSFRQVGVKVGAKVIPGTYERVEGELLHRFDVQDLSGESVRFTVEYRDALPDTFTDDAEVVVEGRLDENGVFQATTLLTKCGSRYEASQEELAG
jgi:cytochrome c-type biogenesis protein CcmE